VNDHLLSLKEGPILEGDASNVAGGPHVKPERAGVVLRSDAPDVSVVKDQVEVGRIFEV